jgi:tetratricopeptide (TPR) repeat protein
MAAAAWATIAGASPVAASLTESARLAAVYDAILDARFDRIETQLKAACPPAPREACQALTAEAVWWQILIHPESRLLDGRLNDVAAAAIAANDAWTRREPERGEAWFYLAGSYGPLVQWRILRGERLAAAREGKKIKDALERALRLDPTLNDAYFGIGLYRYYADVAPASAKLLRWLLLLPGGDRAAGLGAMIRARAHGELLTGEADYQLHQIYLWYEHRPRDALGLLQALDARYPANPLFLQRIAETQDLYLHDARASAHAWQALLDRAQGGRVYGARIAEVRARLGLASALSAMNETERAIEQLEIVVDSHPIAPAGARARAEQQLRDARARRAKK